MKSKQIMYNCIIMPILIGSIIFCMACPRPMHRIRFISKGGTKEKIKIKLPENEITLEIRGRTMDYAMPMIPLGLSIKAKYECNIPLSFHPENLNATINGKHMMCRPDSLNMKIEHTSASIYIYCSCSFNKEEIEYTRETANLIKLSLDNFLEYNDSSIFIDTVLATAPKLKTYYSFKK